MLKNRCLIVLCLFFALNAQSQKREKIDPALTEDWSRKPVVMTGVPLKWDIPSDAIVLLDLVDNNINVINFKNKKSRSFEEGAIIGMTTKIGEYFDKIRLEQGL